MILTHVGYSVSFRVNDVTAQWLLQTVLNIHMFVLNCNTSSKILKVLFYNYFLLLP